MRIIKEGYTNLLFEKKYLEERLELINYYQNYLHLEEEKLKKLLERNKNVAKEIKKTISSLNGIENNLYKSIVIEGIPVTKAVDKASFLFGLDPSTIWKSYYPNVKKLIQELTDSSEIPVTSI